MAWVAIGAAVVSTVGGAMLSDDAGAEAANNASSEASKIQSQIGKEQWDRYKSVYGPIEDEWVASSKGLGSIANQNSGAQQAEADVAGSFAKVRQNLDTVPGANPSSQAYIQEQNRINLAEAATSAAAQTGARQKVQDKGRAAISDVVSVGKGMPGNAVSALGAGASGMRSAGQYAQNRADASASGFGQVVGGITGSKAFKDWAGATTTPSAPATSFGSGDYYGRQDLGQNL